MTGEDFKKTITTKELLGKHPLSGTPFCQLCLEPSPEMGEDGYTECCNEPTVLANEALAAAKGDDTLGYLRNISKASASGLLESRKFTLEDGKTFTLDLTKTDEQGIIEAVNKETRVS